MYLGTTLPAQLADGSGIGHLPSSGKEVALANLQPIKPWGLA